MKSLFDEDAGGEDEGAARPDRRCTPELLLAFIGQCKAVNGKSPTLLECKQRFGGVLGPLVDFWALKDRGLV